MAAEKAKLSKTEYQKIFLRLSETVGDDLAIFCICAVADIPYVPELDAGSWKEYADMVKTEDGGDTVGFADGETDVHTIMAKNRSQMEEWKAIWGTNGTDNPYTEDDYIRLDELFKTYTARLVAAGGMDVQQEEVLRSTCQDKLLSEKCRAQGTKESIAMYMQLNKTIQDNLSSENLRKKDAKPIETSRLDGIIDALTKKYGLSIGMTWEEAVAFCSEWLVGHKSKMTKCAYDEAILTIINTARSNNDEQLLDKLPDGTFDGLDDQFAPVFSDEEDEVFEYLGIERNGDGAKRRAGRTAEFQRPKLKSEE